MGVVQQINQVFYLRVTESKESIQFGFKMVHPFTSYNSQLQRRTLKYNTHLFKPNWHITQNKYYKQSNYHPPYSDTPVVQRTIHKNYYNDIDARRSPFAGNLYLLCSPVRSSRAVLALSRGKD